LVVGLAAADLDQVAREVVSPVNSVDLVDRAEVPLILGRDVLALAC
jgi:hypothetical protein